MLIQRLNMDNSWYLGFEGLRLLVDPWLEGVIQNGLVYKVNVHNNSNGIFVHYLRD
jgi:hypothetical protein